MKRLSFVFVLMLLVVTFSGCHFGKLGPSVTGSGVRKTEKRDVPAFKAIETEGAFELEAVCQKPESFEIEADDNILPLIQSEVRNGVLHLKAKQGYNSRQGVIVRITVPNLESIEATGAGKFRIQGAEERQLRSALNRRFARRRLRRNKSIRDPHHWRRLCRHTYPPRAKSQRQLDGRGESRGLRERTT